MAGSLVGVGTGEDWVAAREGVTALLCADSGPEPSAVLAMTVKVYVTPSVSPETIALLAGPGTVVVLTMFAPEYVVIV